MLRSYKPTNKIQRGWNEIPKFYKIRWWKLVIFEVSLKSILNKINLPFVWLTDWTRCDELKFVIPYFKGFYNIYLRNWNFIYLVSLVLLKPDIISGCDRFEWRMPYNFRILPFIVANWIAWTYIFNMRTK